MKVAPKDDFAASMILYKLGLKTKTAAPPKRNRHNETD
jgi:hypothetical protein